MKISTTWTQTDWDKALKKFGNYPEILKKY